MLFQRIYSWLKYRSPTPSFRAKNRILIERDGKDKRISGAFRFMFQNNNWIMFGRRQVSRFFSRRFLKKFLKWFSIFIFLCYIFRFYESIYSSLTGINFVFWISIDFVNYAVLFSIWLTLSLILLLRRAFLFFFAPSASSDLGFFNWFINKTHQLLENGFPTPSQALDKMLNQIGRLPFIWDFSSPISLPKIRSYIKNFFDSALAPNPAFESDIFKVIFRAHRNLGKEVGRRKHILRDHIVNRHEFWNQIKLGPKDFVWLQEACERAFPGQSDWDLFVRFSLWMPNLVDAYGVIMRAFPQLADLKFKDIKTYVMNFLINTKNRIQTSISHILNDVEPVVTPAEFEETKNVRIQRWGYSYSLLYRKFNYTLVSLSKANLYFNTSSHSVPNVFNNLWQSEKLSQISSDMMRNLTNLFKINYLNNAPIDNFFSSNLNQISFPFNKALNAFPDSFSWFNKRNLFLATLNADHLQWVSDFKLLNNNLNFKNLSEKYNLKTPSIVNFWNINFFIFPQNSNLMSFNFIQLLDEKILESYCNLLHYTQLLSDTDIQTLSNFSSPIFNPWLRTNLIDFLVTNQILFKSRWR